MSQSHLRHMGSGPRPNLQAAQGIEDDSVSSKASASFTQQSLSEFEDTPVEPRWVRIDTNATRVENSRSFGNPCREPLGRALRY